MLAEVQISQKMAVWSAMQASWMGIVELLEPLEQFLVLSDSTALTGRK